MNKCQLTFKKTTVKIGWKYIKHDVEKVKSHWPWSIVAVDKKKQIYYVWQVSMKHTKKGNQFNENTNTYISFKNKEQYIYLCTVEIIY